MNETRSPSPGKDFRYLLDQSYQSLSDSDLPQRSLKELQAENSVLKAHIQLLLKEKSLHKEYKTKIEDYLRKIHVQYTTERAQFIQQVQALQAELAKATQKYASLKHRRRQARAVPPKLPAQAASTTGLSALSQTIVDLEIEQAELRRGLTTSKRSDSKLLQQHLTSTECKLAEARQLQDSLLESSMARPVRRLK